MLFWKNSITKKFAILNAINRMGKYGDKYYSRYFFLPYVVPQCLAWINENLCLHMSYIDSQSLSSTCRLTTDLPFICLDRAFLFYLSIWLPLCLSDCHNARVSGSAVWRRENSHVLVSSQSAAVCVYQDLGEHEKHTHTSTHSCFWPLIHTFSPHKA